MNKISDNFTVNYEWITNLLYISHPTKLRIIRYTWSDTDERLFFLDSQNKFLKNDLDFVSFPGLSSFSKYLSDSGFGVCAEAHDCCFLDITRGPQSFAFGHFFVDILPFLFILNLYKQIFPIRPCYRVLLYSLTNWQKDLLDLFDLPIKSVCTIDTFASSHVSAIDDSKLIRSYHINRWKY